MSQEIQIATSRSIDRPLNPAEMMKSMVDKGITAENVAAFTELVKLSEHVEDRNAAREFAAAFVALQMEIPQIKATKSVPDKHGNVKFMVAPYEEIDAQLRPLALKHGFTYVFTEGAPQQARISKICIVKHCGGHEQRNEYTVRIGSGPPGATESQADGAAHSYAKRGALCDAFSIVIDRAFESDPREEGGLISKDQAFELERRVAETNSDKTKFLNLAGVSKYEDIRVGKYDMLDKLLREKEKRGR